jgi:outer membrane protein
MFRILAPPPPRIRVRSGKRPRPGQRPPAQRFAHVLGGVVWGALVLGAVAAPPVSAQAGAAQPVSAQRSAAQLGGSGLTLNEAIQRAVEAQTSVRGARGDLQSAEWGERTARAALLPSASVGSSASWQGRGEQRLGSLTSGELGFAAQPTWLFSSWSAGVSLSLSGSTLLAPQEAAHVVAGATSRIRAVEASVAFDVTRSYLDVLRREEGLRLAERELERARVNLSLAQSRVSVGSATPLDERQAEIAAGRAEITVLRERGDLEGARITLRLLLGESPSTPLPPLTTRFDLERAEVEEEALLGLALRRNPELAQLRSQTAQSEVAVRSAQSQFLPSLSISAGWGGFTRRAVDGEALVVQGEAQVLGQRAQCLSQNDLRSRLSPPLPPLDCDRFIFGEADRARILDGNRKFPFDFTGQPPSASVSVSLPLFQGLQRRRQLETAKVNQSQARLRTEERERTLTGDVARGILTLRTAVEAARLEARNLELAEAQLQLARDQYEVGLTDFIQLSEAESVLARAERERLGTLFAVHEALASLELLVGSPLPNR